MQVKHLLEEKGTSVEKINARETIHAAIQKLNHYGFGALVVTNEDGQIAGIVTERDILKCCGETCTHTRAAPSPENVLCQVLVGDIMTRNLVIGVPDDDLNYVMGIMTKHQIRHLPILQDGKLAGIISISDLVNAHLEEHVFESRTLNQYLYGRKKTH